MADIKLQVTQRFPKFLYGEGFTKVHIATHQVRSAIRMLFDDKFDPISIHTLVSSAFQILRDLTKQRDSQYWTMLEKNLNQEGKQEFYRAMNSDWTIFKHAGTDPDLIYSGLREKTTDMNIYTSVRILEDYGVKDPEFEVFKLWFAALNIQLFKELNEKIKGIRPHLELLERVDIRRAGATMMKYKGNLLSNSEI